LAVAGLATAGDDERSLLAQYALRAGAAVWVSALEEEVRELTTIDPVTRLYDGRYFGQRIEQEIGRAARQGAPFAILVASVDGVDDLRARGRDALADDALLDLAILVGHSRRSMDVACRLAGDEIGLILPDASGLDAMLAADRLRAAAAARISASGPRTLSIGISPYPEAGTGRDALVGSARAALRWARTHGGDRAFLYSAEVAQTLESEERAHVEGDEAFLATVYALAAAVDARDPLTREHGQNVGRIAALLAQELALPAPHIEEIRTAGLLHDVGKIGVADRVLRKETPLTEEDWKEMREHPRVAYRILAGTRLEALRPWILHHHECMDGSGYPDGIAGDAIPLEARILGVAEAYESLVQGRPYQRPVSPEEASEEVSRGSGSKFDPSVAAALRALVHRGEPGVLPRPAS
jgi:diguanylate cyclase (GGDEF)-like protein